MKKIISLIFILLSSPAFSGSSEPAAVNLPDTTVSLTNSSTSDVTVSLRVNFDAALNSSEYQLLTTHIPALATRDVLRFSRTDGIQENQDYAYFIDVSNAVNTITLSQVVTGKGNGDSRVQFGASGANLYVAPQSSFSIQRHATQFDGSATVAFNAETNSNADTINYVIQQDDKKPSLGAANALNVLSYNVWATTIFGSTDVSTRLNEMPAVMSGYDVIVGTELFDDIPSSQLLSKLRGEYPYQTGKAFKIGKLLESGTRVISRWPIEKEEYFFYDACNGIQCPASRAAIYVQINKGGNRYHVIGTHLQSSDDDANRNARLAQLNELAGYIQSLNLPADEPVIFAGDFNVNKIGLPGDRDLMVSLLNATEPTNTGHNLTFDSNTNHWASAPYLEFLDYTLYSNVNRVPVTAEMNVFAPRSLIDSLWKKWDLADHYALRGLFTYDTPASPQRPSFPYGGDIVHFKTKNGHYMRAMSGGGSFISAGSDEIGTWESFKVVDLGNNRVALQARDGHYITLDSHLVGTLKATAHNIGGDETFQLVNLGNNKVGIKAANGRYLRADFGGGVGLSAASSSIGNNQTFTMIRP